MGFIRKYRTYLILLAVLVLVSVLLSRNRGQGTYRKGDRDFAVTDTSGVRLVEINRGSETVILVREETGWRVDGVYPAQEERIRGLMVLLSGLEVRAPAPKQDRERVSATLEAKGKDVHILFEGGAEKNYRICYDSTDDASYMQLNGSEIPFAVGIRGYRNRDLEALYILDARYWRDNAILDFLPGQIRSVFLEHTQDPSSSFHLDRGESGSFLLARGILPGDWTVPDPGRLTQYLQYFSNVRFESFTDPEQLAREGITAGDKPEFVLRLVSMSMNQVRIELFSMYRDDGAGGRREDPDRILARAGEKNEFVILKYVEIDPLLKPYSYFRGD